MRTIYEIHRVGANGSATTFKVIHDGRPSYNRLCFTSVVYLSSWNGRKLFNQELHKEHWDTVEEAYREMMLEYFYVFSARFRERDFL